MWTSCFRMMKSCHICINWPKEVFSQKLSRGEICVANFKPPANSASLGSFCVQNLSQVRSDQVRLGQVSLGWLGQVRPQTDRQTNSLTSYTGVCEFFLSIKFATFHSLRLQGDKKMGPYLYILWHYKIAIDNTFFRFVFI